MFRISKVLVGLSAMAFLASGAYASCKGEGKSCDMKDGKKSCDIHKGGKHGYKHDSMCSMKKEKEGHNSPKMIMKSIEKLDLTSDQRAKISEIKKKYHATMPKISDAFSQTSLDLDKLNEALNFEVSTIQSKIISESYNVLNDIQKKYLKEMLDKKANHKHGHHHKSGERKSCEMK